MEIVLFIILISSFLVANVYAHLSLLDKVKKIEESLEKFNLQYFESIDNLNDCNSESFDDLIENFNELDNKIVELANQLELSLLSLKETASQKSYEGKPNNWDSIKEAFKKPIRTELKEIN